MRYLKLFVVLFFVLTSCSKEDEPKFSYQISDKLTKYVINLSNNKIVGYSKFINNELIKTTSFQFSDSAVVRLTSDSENQVTYKSVFRIGDNSLAISCIDSGFSKNRLLIRQSDFEYENGFLVRSTMDWKVLGDNADSGQLHITRILENENIRSSNEALSGWISGCTDYYDYNSTPNMIDVIDFSNGITGKIMKNLIEHASWNSGCPCGPSCSVSCSDFEYQIDNEGYITKMIEIYTPSYHSSSSEEVVKEIRTTIYEYNAR